jgi:hypothetical protein
MQFPGCREQRAWNVSLTENILIDYSERSLGRTPRHYSKPLRNNFILSQGRGVNDMVNLPQSE